MDAIGGPPSESRVDRSGRLVKFYAETIAAIPPSEPIGEEPYKFWRTRFAAAFASPPAARETTRDTWLRAVPPDVSAEDRATMAALRAGREAAEDAAEEAAARAYDELTADRRTELEQLAREELKTYLPRMTAEAFAESVRRHVILALKNDQHAQRKHG